MLRRVVGLSLAAASLLSAVATAAPATGPGALLAASLKVAKAQRSVHYVADFSGLNPVSRRSEHVTIVGDAAVSRGVQRITFRMGGRRGGVTVVVVSGRAYVRGDAFTLRNYMGFAASAAAADAGHWLLISPNGFATVADGVRLASAVDELRLARTVGPARPAVRSGTRVIGITGVVSRFGQQYTQTIYVRAAGSPLPVAEVGRSGNERLTVRFGPWNAPVSVSPPTHARPVA